MKEIITFQKHILSLKSDVLSSGVDGAYCFMFCFINVPVAFVVGMILFIYHRADSLYSLAPKKYKVASLYLSGYTLFIIMMLVFLGIMCLIGIPLRYFSTGHLNGLYTELTTMTLKGLMEGIYCICIYQFSIFCILHSQQKGVNRKRMFLAIIFLSGVLFFFARVWILDSMLLQYMMYVLLFVSIVMLPLLSSIFIKQQEKCVI